VLTGGIAGLATAMIERAGLAHTHASFSDDSSVSPSHRYATNGPSFATLKSRHANRGEITLGVPVNQ
jgi:hypothetical protein